MICTGCGMEIPPYVKYVAAFFGGWGDLTLRVGCAHRDVPDLNFAAGVFGSGGCLQDFLDTWGESLTACDHKAAS